MANDTLAVAPQAAIAPGAPSPAPASGPRYWHAQAKDRIWVRLLFVSGNKIDVGIWWNRLGRNPDIQLVFGLYSHSVELGCLTGNGFDAPEFHRLGFGTCAVNVAVQALQSWCPASHLVQGVLSNTAEARLPQADRTRLEANRRAFWRRFGLDVETRGDPPLDYLRGRVGELKLVAGGLVAGQFPRLIALGEFVTKAPPGF